MTIHCFSYQPCSPVAPFDPLPVEREIGFTDVDYALPGEYLGDIIKDPEGCWCYIQRSTSFRLRLSPKNLRTIADRIDHLTNEEKKLRAKKSKLNRPTFRKAPRH